MEVYWVIVVLVTPPIVPVYYLDRILRETRIESRILGETRHRERERKGEQIKIINKIVNTNISCKARVSQSHRVNVPQASSYYYCYLHSLTIGFMFYGTSSAYNLPYAYID
jgi:hypothetical protein